MWHVDWGCNVLINLEPLIWISWTRVCLIIEDAWCALRLCLHRIYYGKTILKLFRPGTRTQVLDVEALSVCQLSQ